MIHMYQDVNKPDKLFQSKQTRNSPLQSSERKRSLLFGHDDCIAPRIFFLWTGCLALIRSFGKKDAFLDEKNFVMTEQARASPLVLFCDWRKTRLVWHNLSVRPPKGFHNGARIYICTGLLQGLLRNWKQHSLGILNFRTAFIKRNHERMKFWLLKHDRL